jgi:hypothetical protein
MNDIVTQGSNALAQWDPNSGAALPAYLADALGELGSNIPDRQTVPSLSYEGKTWQVVMNGEKRKLQATNADGDLVPIPIMRTVILNFNPARGRAYYLGTYDPSKSSAPECWSADGVAPDTSVKNKQAALCNACPMSVKGSKVQDGKEIVACSSHRMLAVAAALDLDHDPLRLKIAVTSDYDKEVVEHGWFAFRQYADWLKSRGVSNTALVVTKIKFDANAQYPKLLFALDRPLTPEELAKVKTHLAGTKVAELLAEKWTAAGTAGTPIDDSDIAPQPDLQTTEPEPAPAVEKASPNKTSHDLALEDGWVQHPDSAPHGYKGQEVLAWEAIEERYPVVGAAPAPAPQPAPPPPVVAAEPVKVDPLDAAHVDGWVPHPDAPGYHYKGQDVKTDAEVVALYAGNAAAEPAAPASPAPVAATTEPTVAPSEVTTAAAGAELTPDVADLLSKWATS